MARERFVLLLAFLIAAALLTGCAAAQGPEGPVGPAGPAGPLGPPGPAGDAATASQSFVGSDKCAACHEAVYDKFVQSGHPYKLTKIEEGIPPAYPHDEVTGGVTEAPVGYTWDDVSYVIGGFGWKARFMDQRGYIITGDAGATTQYNFANAEVGTEAEWVAYRPGEEVPYDCGGCHTTGYRPEGHQDDRPGIVGTWAFPGVQCEACHGPGSRHAEDPYGVRMVIERDSQLCGECHVRGNPAEIDASDGFTLHHEQYEDLYSSKHFALSCVTCHDPHASALFQDEEFNPNQGIRQTCETCHWQQRFEKNKKHLGVACVDCHMAPLGRSAAADLERFTGDVRSHLFSINTDPAAPQFRDEGAYSMPYITLAYACQHCHNGEVAAVKELDVLAAMAEGYHTPPTPTPEPTVEPGPAVTGTPAAPG
jgi:hypothetical protein